MSFSSMLMLYSWIVHVEQSFHMLSTYCKLLESRTDTDRAKSGNEASGLNLLPWPGNLDLVYSTLQYNEYIGYLAYLVGNVVQVFLHSKAQAL